MRFDRRSREVFLGVAMVCLPGKNTRPSMGYLGSHPTSGECVSKHVLAYSLRIRLQSLLNLCIVPTAQEAGAAAIFVSHTSSISGLHSEQCNWRDGR